MALARVSSLHPELKLEIYYHFHHKDLLAVSHVSRFWRSLALNDVRWRVWFDMIVDPKSGVPIRESLADMKVSGAISKRAMVTLCFTTKCSMCYQDTTAVCIPLLKRVCTECITVDPTLSVMSVASALSFYDLEESDLASLIIVCVAPFKFHDEHARNTAEQKNSVAISLFGKHVSSLRTSRAPPTTIPRAPHAGGSKPRAI
ncbi:hypothetical protein FB45DRAFT_940211 [Roridomyces roridus]|uniref:F-box domain-containing protein n=1 Tax=Roridomyces roridus TaxID=1738132 RepID=A0AAD7FAK1_9AGAR|nr:hypothetical protein FB45DRAFT_940211 [Roridomyces roridus]